MNIQIEDPFESQVDAQRLYHAAQVALDHQAITEPVDLSIVVSDDAELQRLNHEFLGIDAPTDVLSFPSEETDPSSGERYLGDIIISFPRAEGQARQAGHGTIDEMELLVVHGILHLLGYDHATDEDKQRMWAAQEKILERIGNPIKNVPG